MKHGVLINLSVNIQWSKLCEFSAIETFFYWMVSNDKILWHVDPLLGNDRETSNYTTAIAK
jgi:hypothetical protein